MQREVQPLMHDDPPPPKSVSRSTYASNSLDLGASAISNPFWDKMKHALLPLIRKKIEERLRPFIRLFDPSPLLAGCPGTIVGTAEPIRGAYHS